MANKFKYNGIEYEDNTGLYEMDLRAYDPAIARWNRIDPVEHHSLSTYNAFDNNPIFFSDPSGGNSSAFLRTVVNNDGEVIYHKKDIFDNNIYLNYVGGTVIGQEEEGKEYKIGDKVANVDKSNPNYTTYSIINGIVGALSTQTTIVLNVPQSIPVYNTAGVRIGTWYTKLKVPFRALRFIAGKLSPITKGAGPIIAGLTTINDLVDYKNGDITGGKFGFRTVGTVTSFAVAGSIGGPTGTVAGVAVGFVFYSGELVYEGVKASASDRSDPDNNANTIHSIGEFFRNFGWFLDNLERGLGEGISND